MRLKKIIDVEDAVAIIHDGDVVASSGYGGNGTPDELFVALEERFLRTGSPRDLTLVFAGGQGDGVDKGLSHLGHEGLVSRVIGGPSAGARLRSGARKSSMSPSAACFASRMALSGLPKWPPASTWNATCSLCCPSGRAWTRPR